MSEPNSAQRAGRKSGAANFDCIEDALLAKIWALVSVDPIVGADQKSDDFWQKICDLFNQARKDVDGAAVRQPKGLKGRWNNFVNKNVAKFVACVQRSTLNERSGWNREKYFDEAKAFYTADTKQPFKFEKAFNELSHLPKFSIISSKTPASLRRALCVVDGVDIGDQSADELDADPTNLDGRPKVGRKRGKSLREEEAQLKVENAVKKQKSESLSQLASASIRRNQLFEAQIEWQLFSSLSPSDPRFIRYQDLKLKIAMDQLEAENKKRNEQAASEDDDDDNQQDNDDEEEDEEEDEDDEQQNDSDDELLVQDEE